MKTLNSEQAKIKMAVDKVVEEIMGHNGDFSEQTKELFEKIKNSQSPVMTLVYCSDSRVQVTSIVKQPINYVFGIENIGNQLSTALGSVMYGVEHLHTIILMFLGHTGCGAIHAALSDFSGEKEPIRKELSTIAAARGKNVHDDYGEALVAQANVDYQVQEALKYFGGYVNDSKLVIMGAMKDIKGVYSGKLGKIYITNVNGRLTENRLK